MTNIRRYFQDNGIAFLTHVTFNRLPILIDYHDAFWKAVKKQQSKINFDIIARVILPDHFHMLISAGENDISTLMKKLSFHFQRNIDN